MLKTSIAIVEVSGMIRRFFGPYALDADILEVAKLTNDGDGWTIDGPFRTDGWWTRYTGVRLTDRQLKAAIKRAKVPA